MNGVQSSWNITAHSHFLIYISDIFHFQMKAIQSIVLLFVVFLGAIVSGVMASHEEPCISYRDCAGCHFRCFSQDYDFGYCQQSTGCTASEPYKCLCLKLWHNWHNVCHFPALFSIDLDREKIMYLYHYTVSDGHCFVKTCDVNTKYSLQTPVQIISLFNTLKIQIKRIDKKTTGMLTYTTCWCCHSPLLYLWLIKGRLNKIILIFISLFTLYQDQHILNCPLNSRYPQPVHFKLSPLNVYFLH